MGKDAYYFSHDANASNDPKILSMRCDYGLEGYGMYWLIIEALRNEADYKLQLDKCTYRALAMQMHSKPDAIKKYIEDCINEYKLFCSDEENFWAESLLKRMGKLEDIRIKRKAAAEKRWNNEEVMQVHSKSKASAMQLDAKERKRKEKKGKEKKEYNTPTEPIYKDIIEYLNSKTKSNYKITEANKKPIKARLKEKYLLQDFITVIDKKTTEWIGTEYEKYLQPSTLFGNKFDGYLNQKEKLKIKEVENDGNGIYDYDKLFE